MPLTTSTLKMKLENICDTNCRSIRSSVAEEALNYHCPKDFFSDLLKQGCISGMVSSLIYYSDTYRFYDEHYAAIETIRKDLEENFGGPLPVSGDIKNYYAWLAFEETAYQLSLDLGLLD